MSAPIVVEICLDDLAGVRHARDAGADRIELCAALSEGGLTPSIGVVATALTSCGSLGINVLIRARGGDFSFDDDEIAAMAADIHAIQALANPRGVPIGFVIGALNPDGTLDTAALRTLLAACAGASTTFHKAFDLVPDRSAALETLIDLGFHRVLTSGGATTAIQGAQELAQLVTQAGDRMTVLAGGGVRPSNVAELIQRTGVSEVHLRAVPELLDGGQTVGRPTSPAVIAAIIAQVRQASQ